MKTQHEQSTLLDLDSRHINSYVTEANLVKAMQRDGVRHYRHLVVLTPKRRRWTAVIIGFQQELLSTGWPMIS